MRVAPGDKLFGRRLLVPLLAAAAVSAFAVSDYTISDNVDLVLLDVRVKDKTGSFASGLNRSNFKVYEDGRPRQITQFGNMDEPVTVGLVLDDSGSMKSKRPEVVTAGLAFAKCSNPHDDFFVINFNDNAYFGLPPDVAFTDSIQLLRQALYYGRPQGRTALYDAVALALHHLAMSHLTLRTLIVVSDGGDNASTMSYGELMKRIEASRATIYSVGLADPEDQDLKPAVLRKFASVSGGEYFAPARLDEIVPLFEKISKDLRNRYTVGFIPDEVADQRTLRRVKVVVEADGRKLNVRTRSTYSISPTVEK